MHAEYKNMCDYPLTCEERKACEQFYLVYVSKQVLVGFKTFLNPSITMKHACTLKPCFACVV